MSAADAAIEMGPRSRRRVTTGAIGLAVVAAIALWAGAGGSLFSRSGNHSGIHHRVLRMNVDQLIYGMTKPQVLHRLGHPQKIAGQCWQYPENIKNFVGDTINAVRVCFTYGVYATPYYMQVNGTWRDQRSNRIVIAPPTH